MALLQYFDEEKVEAGCDEAGRGCLAGPVVCAAVILPENFSSKLLNDSKQLTESQRNDLKLIIEQEAIAYNVQFVDEAEIARINILKASLTGMGRAAHALSPLPELILVDGNKTLLDKRIPSVALIKGDAKYLSIAAASVLAKTYRDEFMQRLHEEFPMYGWDVNKGYPTPKHRDAIREFGPCKYHRMGFRLLPEGQTSLF